MNYSKNASQQHMTRRSFMKASAVGAAFGLASVSTLSGCQSTEKEEASEQSWDHEADIVVLGFGSAGASAAVEAVGAGNSVLIVEKMPEEDAGGDSSCNGGLLFMPAATAKEVEFGSFGYIDSEWGALIEEEAQKSIQWLSDQGLEMTTDDSGAGISSGMGLVTAVGAGVALYETIKQGVADLDIPVLYETPGKGLIQHDETGEIIGVAAEQNGQEVRIKANKAVILATGSYTANNDLVNKYNIPGVLFHPQGAPSTTGDGLLMGMAVGADLGQMSMGAEWSYACSYKAAGDEIGLGLIGYKPPHDSRITVNMAGKRFMDETVSKAHGKNQMPFFAFTGDSFTGYLGYDNLPMFWVFDDACIKSGTMGNTHFEYTWAIAREKYIWSEDNSEELDRGWILKADTIEELASKMTATDYFGKSYQMDPNALAETIASYNEYCVTGIDADFARPATKLFPLSTPPFYAAEMIPSISYTIAGLKCNIHGQTINTKDEPIPRLYSVGNVGQAGVVMGPYGVPGCMACGTIAARHATTLELWDSASNAQ